LTQSQIRAYARDIVYFAPLFKHISESTRLSAEE
jgi:hypothetical protein